MRTLACCSVFEILANSCIQVIISVRSDSYSRFARGFGFFRFRKLVPPGLYIECNVSLLDILDALLTASSRVFAILKISSTEYDK